MDDRRTNPGYLSNGEATQESLRTEAMVRSIVNYKHSPKTEETSTFVADRRFWSSGQGRIIRAIVLSGAYTKDAILNVSKLSKEDFEQAFEALLHRNLVEKRDNGQFWANKQLYGQCVNFFRELQEALVNWAQEWRSQERVGLITDHKLSHFYLSDMRLSKFSESLIEQAKHEILVTNPYVKRCFISNALMKMSEKGITVNVMTRNVETEQYKSELMAKGIAICYDESIHAKLIVVDRCVGIVSSMNFYAGSWGGACWEAGIATTEREVVNSITDSILTKRKDILCAQATE